MDKTVTANFESVDMATFAVKNVTDHFSGVKKVKVSYQRNPGERNRDTMPFSAYVVPYGPYGGSGMPMGLGMDSGTTNGLLPLAVGMAALRNDGREAAEPRKAKVFITAPENLIQQIESTLHSGGGLGVQVS